MARPANAELQRRQKLEANRRRVPFSSLSSRQKNKDVKCQPLALTSLTTADCHFDKKALSLPKFPIQNFGLPSCYYHD